MLKSATIFEHALCAIKIQKRRNLLKSAIIFEHPLRAIKIQKSENCLSPQPFLNTHCVSLNYKKGEIYPPRSGAANPPPSLMLDDG